MGEWRANIKKELRTDFVGNQLYSQAGQEKKYSQNWGSGHCYY